jgi:hypothetical protein
MDVWKGRTEINRALNTEGGGVGDKNPPLVGLTRVNRLTLV